MQQLVNVHKLLILLMVIFLTTFASCDNKINVPPPEQLQITEHRLSVHKFGGDVLQSTAAIDGNAKNSGNVTLSSVTISVTFYDKDNNILQKASTSKQNMAVGEIWHFEVRFTSPDAWKSVRYDINDFITSP